jgi:hypothetical protein
MNYGNTRHDSQEPSAPSGERYASSPSYRARYAAYERTM